MNDFFENQVQRMLGVFSVGNKTTDTVERINRRILCILSIHGAQNHGLGQNRQDWNGPSFVFFSNSL